ncbi:unnamed protein product [Rotaria sordida]|uniref:Uncharacterized protein n=1 Tax=Rotaria sordida TaxID=392033 RepID=A0A818UKT5_9BILA|nr:unnamed protein product [Rotaria sordida]
MTMLHHFLFRVAAAAGHINWTTYAPSNALLSHHSILISNLIQNEYRRYNSSDVTGVAFSPLPDAELKIQLYYKTQEIKKRKEKLKQIAQSIWNKKPNVDYARITLNECKTMYEEHTGHVPSPWEAKQIYSVTLEQYAPWRHFQEEKERQKHVTAMIEEIYNDLKKEVKQGKDLTLSKYDMTILLERKLGELPSSLDVENMWMDRFRLPLVKWLE